MSIGICQFKLSNYEKFCTPQQLNSLVQIPMIASREEFLYLKYELLPSYSRINNPIVIDHAFNTIIDSFHLLNEELKIELSLAIHNLKTGIKMVFEAEEECDTIKLSDGSNLIKCIVSFAKKL